MRFSFYSYISLLVFCVSIVIFNSACKQEAHRHETAAVPRSFPPTVTSIFGAHGGYTLWDKMKSLSFEIVKEVQNEKQIIQLKDRREWIEGDNFTMGDDGTQIWVKADTSYKGNPKFYKNLMFYFYAMPFVLGDEGINYYESAPIVFEGVSYPGIKITYNDGVGVSPKDEYFLYYDSNTHEMQWLAYTVTFFSNEKSDRLSWIRYSDWANYKGLKLPKSLVWYNSENGLPTAPRNTREFANVQISEEAPADTIFAMPADAAVAK
jgi:hypothetical protein